MRLSILAVFGLVFASTSFAQSVNCTGLVKMTPLEGDAAIGTLKLTAQGSDVQPNYAGQLVFGDSDAINVTIDASADPARINANFSSSGEYVLTATLKQFNDGDKTYAEISGSVDPAPGNTDTSNQGKFEGLLSCATTQ